MPFRFSAADDGAANSGASTEPLLDMPWGGRDWAMSTKAPQQKLLIE